MTDFSKRIDMGGDDIIINSLMYSSTPGGSVARVIDVSGSTPTVNSTTAGTMTFAMMLAGMYCATNAGATTITLDTAANIVAGLNTSYSGAQIGDTIVFTIAASAGGVGTLTIGTGNTLSTGSVGTVAANTQRTYQVKVTNVSTPACTVYC